VTKKLSTRLNQFNYFQPPMRIINLLQGITSGLHE